MVRRWTEHRGRSLWEWAAGSRLRTALAWGIYLCLGACLGLVWGLLGGERFGGAVVGAGLGVYIGHTLRRPIGGEADPAELQRSAMVRAAVNRGEAPSDPSLAEETIALARMRQDPPGLRNAWLFFAGTDAVLFAMAWGRARAGSLGDAAVIGVPALILMPLMVWMRLRYTQRARRAEAAAVRQMTA